VFNWSNFLELTPGPSLKHLRAQGLREGDEHLPMLSRGAFIYFFIYLLTKCYIQMYYHVQREQDNKAQITGTDSCPLSLNHSNRYKYNAMHLPFQKLCKIYRSMVNFTFTWRICLTRHLTVSLSVIRMTRQILEPFLMKFFGGLWCVTSKKLDFGGDLNHIMLG